MSLILCFGVDLSAAVHADVLFVKNDKPEGQNDLATYWYVVLCAFSLHPDLRPTLRSVRQGIKHILFKDFNEALPIVASIVEGKSTVEEALKASPV